MPHLSRVRFVSVGHPHARLQDQTLDFRNEQGHATDSTLWLRNGGGKSSILNLLFACLRPSRRDFLGGKAESKSRRLEDYVQSDDRSVVVCEWEFPLDAASNGHTKPRRMLTGVFYEWRGGQKKTTAHLHRLFFSCQTDEQATGLSLETLPLFGGDGGAKNTRRTLAGFRQHWHMLKEQHPKSDVFQTEQQKDWADWLERKQIDPEFFAYQIRMNQREGAADEMFRFRAAEEFTDFLLELVDHSKIAEQIRANLTTFREELKVRTEKLVPEQQLLLGILERLQPLKECRTRRERLCEQFHRLGSELGRSRDQLKDKLNSLAAALQETTTDRDRVAGDITATQTEIQLLRESVARFRWQASVKRCDELQHQLATAEENHQRLANTAKLWEAAVPLFEAQSAEQLTLQRQMQLESVQSASKPLLEELQQAGAVVLATLKHTSDQLQHEASALNEQQQAIQQQQARLQEQLRASELQSTSDKRDLEHARAQLRLVQQQTDGLRAFGVLQPDETTGQAASRLAAAVHISEEKRDTLSTQLGEHQSRLDQLRSEQVHRERDLTVTEQQRDQIQESLTIAERQKTEWESHPLLQECLELESIDLMVSGSQAVSLLAQQLEDNFALLVRLRLRREEEERAIVALEQNGVLPPSPDVELLTTTLKDQIPETMTGWDYLQMQAGGDLNKQREFLAKCPELSQSVMVPADQLEHAAWLAQQVASHMENAVILTSPEEVATPRQQTWRVVGPTSPAHWHRPSAQAELIQRQSQRANSEQKLLTQEQRYRELDLLHRGIREFLQTHSPDWFTLQNQQLTNFTRECEEQETHLQRITARIETTDAQLHQLTDDLKTSEQEIRTVTQHRLQLSSYQDQWEELERLASQQVQELPASCEQQKVEQARLGSEADRLTKSIQEIEQQLDTLRQRQSRLIYEQQEITYTSEAPHECGVVSQPEAMSRYRELKAQHEGQLDEGGVLILKQEAERQAQSARHKFNSLVERDQLDTGEVERLLEPFSSLAQIEDQLRIARQQENQSQSQALVLSEQVRQIITQTQERKRIWDRFQASLPAESAETAEALDVKATEAELAADALTDTVTSLQEGQTRIEQDRVALERQQHRLVRESDKVNYLHNAVEERLSQMGIVEGSSEEDPSSNSLSVGSSIGELANRLEQWETELQRLSESHRQLERERHRLCQGLRQWLGQKQFHDFSSRLITLLISQSDSELEEEVPRYLHEFELRLQTINAQVTAINQHRDLLIQELNHLADDGLYLLRSAANGSRLPEHMPVLGGRQFLQMSWKELPSPADRAEVFGKLIDEMVQTGEVPGALELMQQSVRRILRSLRVQILHPDPATKSGHIDITEVAKFSGGEQLTCAILLYCTLAQLRTQSRGTQQTTSSVLILDNPIGKSSRVRFLELQRDVAQAMDVQLIYTTAVNDFSALRVLPNVIRLRNERVTAGNAERLLELDNKAESEIETARILRKTVEVD